jgi:beta-N-acetylhexosaminidase
MGFLMIDLDGHQLSSEEQDLLQHPAIAGVIYFKKNYQSPQQICELSAQIRELRPDNFLIAVDQEGGRVQRLTDPFTQLPSLGSIGELYEQDPEQAQAVCQAAAMVMACELQAVGIDFSFAPVVDLRHEHSRVIADRGFHANPAVVSKLALLYYYSLQQQGMAAVAKHFPGHGFLVADSHQELPSDQRDYATLFAHDMLPFTALIDAGVEAMMPAHIVFNQVDNLPVGFSEKWLQTILREQLGFQGAIISDDLHMQAACEYGDPVSRVRLAIQAGCDMSLLCHNRAGVYQILDNLGEHYSAASQQRLRRLQSSTHEFVAWHELRQNDTWQKNTAILASTLFGVKA